MQKLIDDLHHVQTAIFDAPQDSFEQPRLGHYPAMRFITCSDSRINPKLLRQTDPGEWFIPRKASNILPPYGAVQRGEAATITLAAAGRNQGHYH
jgi:carbonic anhydrase